MVESREPGPLEMRVLGLLRAGEKMPVNAVRERLEAEGTVLAYTTVMTVLTRLHEKGLVVRTRDGNRYEYAPAARAPRVLEGMLTKVRRALSSSSRARPLVALIEDEQLSDAELRELREAIDKKLGRKSK
jgi:predicted transcriptional regulator